MTTSNLSSNTSNRMTAEQFMNNYYVTTNASTTTTYTFTTTYPSDTWNTTYTAYVPFNGNYIYDTDLQWRYTSNIYGLREYLFANNSYKELGDILYDMYMVSDDAQEFEDSIYRNTLDLLYELTRSEYAFQDLLDEQQYSYQELNKIIYEIIDSYRKNFQTEEF